MKTYSHGISQLKNHRQGWLILASVAGFMAVSLAQAQPITLVNPSFESPGTGKISSGFSTIPGWNYFNGALTATDSGVEDDSPPNGVWNAYMKGADSMNGIYPSQETSYSMLGTETFQLTFAARYTYGSEGPSGSYSQPMMAPAQVEADLYFVSGGAPVVFARDIVTWDASGAGTPWANYTFVAGPPNPHSGFTPGDLLGVDFQNATADSYGFNWVEVDNVGLSVVPEPCTMALLSLGGLALAAFRRRSA